MVTVNVRTLSQKFCTRIFAYFILTKHETRNFAKSSIYVHFWRMLIAGAIILLPVMFVTALVNRTS